MNFKLIDIEDANVKINNKESIVLDIRDKHSFDLGHIDGALNLSNENIHSFIQNTKKNQSIIICCYHGNSSQRAAEFLAGQGFSDVYSLNGGYELWKEK